MKSSQIAWTTALIAYLLWLIDQGHKGTVIGLFSAEGAARDFSLEKLKPFVEGCKKLEGKLDVSTTRKTGNSLLYKSFPGGSLKLVGSNSVRNLKSTPAAKCFVEEPDDASTNTQNQGDSVALLKERQKRMRNALLILGGTPTLKNFSRVGEYIKKSDQRVLPIYCHSCGDAHVLSFDYVQWVEAEEGEPHPIFGMALPDTAYYCCPHCGDIWDDKQRQDNIRKTCFDAKASGDDDAGWTPTKDVKKIAGFKELGEIYSCLPGAGMASLAEKYLTAKYYAERGDETKLISFENNQLGREYEYDDKRPDSESYIELAKADEESQHDELICPRRGLLVTAGVDVQHDRVAVIIRAWSRGEESWLMYWGELYGNTADKKDGVWKDLTHRLFMPFKHETGAEIFLSSMTIDSSDGVTNDAVYYWVREQEKAFPNCLIMAGKGSSKDKGKAEIFVKPSRSIDHKRPDRKTKADKKGLKVFIIGTHKAKDLINVRMGFTGTGEGRFHYYANDQMRSDYFEQMTAEAKVPDKSGTLVWKQKSGRACEAWDCEVYALHAARAKRTHLMSGADWMALQNQLIQNDLFQAQKLELQQSTKRNLTRRPRRR